MVWCLLPGPLCPLCLPPHPGRQVISRASWQPPPGTAAREPQRPAVTVILAPPCSPPCATWLWWPVTSQALGASWQQRPTEESLQRAELPVGGPGGGVGTVPPQPAPGGFRHSPSPFLLESLSAELAQGRSRPTLLRMVLEEAPTGASPSQCGPGGNERQGHFIDGSSGQRQGAARAREAGQEEPQPPRGRGGPRQPVPRGGPGEAREISVEGPTRQTLNQCRITTKQSDT